MLNLAIASGPLSITLVLAITPQGRKLATKAWKWLTGLFEKKLSLPRELSLTVEHETAKGGKFRIDFRFREVLLRNLPPAIGGSLPATAIPQPAQPLLPPQEADTQSPNASQALTIVTPLA
jgi:hypothetical protein